MKNLFTWSRIKWLVFVALAVSAYFINVEVQSYWGRQALAKTGLVSVSLAQALAQAKAENKLVLVDVAAIWCPTCRKLDNEIFADAQVRRVIHEKFVFARLEYESAEGQDFLKKYETNGFPNLWLINGDGMPVKHLAVTFDRDAFLRQLNP